MPYYRVAGEIPGKRHVRFRRPDGGLYSEELMGEEGFVSDSSLLYHTHPPTAIVKSEGISGAEAGQAAPNHPLMPPATCTGTPPATKPFICNTAVRGWSPSTARSTPWPVTMW